MAILESLHPQVRALALLQTSKELTYLRWGKAILGRKHRALVAEAVAARYCQVITFFICLAVYVSGVGSLERDLSRAGKEFFFF
jgi:hypothetical protein